jgi:hypothetical protein
LDPTHPTLQAILRSVVTGGDDEVVVVEDWLFSVFGPHDLGDSEVVAVGDLGSRVLSAAVHDLTELLKVRVDRALRVQLGH